MEGCESEGGGVGGAAGKCAPRNGEVPGTD